MKYVKKKTSLKKSAERISEAGRVKEVVDNTQRVVGEVDTITKTISDTLYIRGNVAVDMQNYSLISISDPKTVI